MSVLSKETIAKRISLGVYLVLLFISTTASALMMFLGIIIVIDISSDLSFLAVILMILGFVLASFFALTVNEKSKKILFRLGVVIVLLAGSGFGVFLAHIFWPVAFP